MDDDVVFFAMVQRYNIYFKYVSLHHDILGSHGAKSSTENIYWAKIGTLFSRHPLLGSHAKAVAEKVIQLGAGRETAGC